MLLSLELALRACSRTASLAALLLFLRRPAPTGTLRSVPPAVQYLWHPCIQATMIRWTVYTVRLKAEL